MAIELPNNQSGVNWAGVALGALLLALLVATIGSVFLRVIAALGVLALTFYLATQGENNAADAAETSNVEHRGPGGLDRRKYGRLRVATEHLLENLRRMNQIAVDGREGKISQRHANAELDRIAAILRDVVEEIRKSVGVPTPIVESGPLTGKVISPANKAAAGPQAAHRSPAGTPREPKAQTAGFGDVGSDTD